MRKILYLLKDRHAARADLFLSDRTPDHETSVILLQDDVGLDHLPISRVYALADDVRTQNVTSSYPVISYADMLRMMFEADLVIVL